MLQWFLPSCALPRSASSRCAFFPKPPRSLGSSMHREDVKLPAHALPISPLSLTNWDPENSEASLVHLRQPGSLASISGRDACAIASPEKVQRCGQRSGSVAMAQVGIPVQYNSVTRAFSPFKLWPRITDLCTAATAVRAGSRPLT